MTSVTAGRSSGVTRSNGRDRTTRHAATQYFERLKIRNSIFASTLRLSLLLSAAGTFAIAGDQPQWGQRHTRNMVSSETGLPDTFDPETGENVKWVAPLGTRSYATPVVASGKVLIGTNNGQPRDPRRQGDRGVLFCLDASDGHLLWQLVVPKIAEDEFRDWPHVGIVSPPTVEGDRVYLVSNRGEVLCLDLNGLADGNDGPFHEEGRHASPEGSPLIAAGKSDADIIWVYDTVDELGVRLHDEAHGSVLLDGEILYVPTSNGVDGTHKLVPSPDAPSLIALEKRTGRLVAVDDVRIGPNIVHCSWSSPSLGEVLGRRLLFFGGSDGICYAFKALSSVPSTHEVAKLENVWRFDCDPAGPRGDLRRYQDNRQVGPSTIIGMPVFHEGRVYVTSGGDLWHGKLEASLKCIDATKSGDVTKSAELWSQPLKRHCMSTPSVVDGLVYVADCGRQVHCFDARTGEVYWVHDARGEIWGSTLVADGKVYVGTRRADSWILAASKDKRVLARVRLDSAMSATPTAAGGVLYVATMSQLYALGVEIGG